MLKYFYDSNGDIRFLLSKSDNFKNQNAFNLYYYVKDGLGNITGLIRVKSQSGSSTVQDKTLVAQYTYDPYGKIESVTRPSGISDDIYQVNPIRYKGYYYDSDSGWYNLKTRYYDPVIARFINTDDVSLIMSSPQAFTDKNLYAYCDNDPINRSDGDGEWWHVVAGAIIGGAVEYFSQMIEYGRVVDKKAIGVAALSGATTAAFGPAVGSLASVAFTTGIESMKGKKLTEAVKSGVVSGLSNYGFSKVGKLAVGISSARNSPKIVEGALKSKKGIPKVKTNYATKARRWWNGVKNLPDQKKVASFYSSFRFGVFGILSTGISRNYRR